MPRPPPLPWGSSSAPLGLRGDRDENRKGAPKTAPQSAQEAEFPSLMDPDGFYKETDFMAQELKLTDLDRPFVSQ